MREITQTGGGNPPITVYDTSGPYTDPAARIDIRNGLAGAARAVDRGARRHDARSTGRRPTTGAGGWPMPKLAELRFDLHRKPRRAQSANVTQMHYARSGIITPEMEYIAMRENQRMRRLRARS